MAQKELFPSVEWVQAMKDKLNTDEKYAQVARKWEGDIRFIVEAEGNLAETLWIYFDLWHGKCKDAYLEEKNSTLKPAFILTGKYGNMVKVITGEVGAMQALMGRMITVRGSFAYMMRNVPTILDFVRCCNEVTDRCL